MAERRRFAGWIVATLVGLVLTAALARVFLHVAPEARSIGKAWFAAPGAALAIVLLLLARKALVGRAKDAARRGVGDG